jgi:hypothetical protein
VYAHIGVCVLLNKSCSQLGFSQPRDVSELLQRQELLSSCKVLVTDYKHTSVEWRTKQWIAGYGVAVVYISASMLETSIA